MVENRAKVFEDSSEKKVMYDHLNT